MSLQWIGVFSGLAGLLWAGLAGLEAGSARAVSKRWTAPSSERVGAVTGWTSRRVLSELRLIGSNPVANGFTPPTEFPNRSRILRLRCGSENNPGVVLPVGLDAVCLEGGTLVDGEGTAGAGSALKAAPQTSPNLTPLKGRTSLLDRRSGATGESDRLSSNGLDVSTDPWERSRAKARSRS